MTISIQFRKLSRFILPHFKNYFILIAYVLWSSYEHLRQWQKQLLPLLLPLLLKSISLIGFLKTNSNVMDPFQNFIISPHTLPYFNCIVPFLREKDILLIRVLSFIE